MQSWYHSSLQKRTPHLPYSIPTRHSHDQSNFVAIWLNCRTHSTALTHGINTDAPGKNLSHATLTHTPSGDRSVCHSLPLEHDGCSSQCLLSFFIHELGAIQNPNICRGQVHKRAFGQSNLLTLCLCTPIT